MIKILINSILFLFFISNVFAFDPQFSMFYSVPLYINPAFAGARHANRAIVHQRWQWPNQAARYTTTHFGFDTYSDKYRSGFGISAIGEQPRRSAGRAARAAARWPGPLPRRVAGAAVAGGGGPLDPFRWPR